jgi:formylglycine-generating enzyme
MRRRERIAAGLLAGLVAVACRSDEVVSDQAAPSATEAAAVPSFAPALPTGSLPTSSVVAPPSSLVVAKPRPRCPLDMVLVAKRDLCVDRFEASLVDARQGAALSPYYPPDGPKSAYIRKIWDDLHGSGTELEHKLALPELPAHQRERAMKPKAISRKGVIPNAYVSGKDAELACKNAGKRLCTLDEWRTACRGEEDRDHPYGDEFEPKKCNVVRDTHPGVLLWENPSINHTDPRFNLITDKQGPLLRKTGATATCASRWGDDAIYDMVGNLDEWIDDPAGTFVGAFYARGRRDGCRAAIENHVFSYADYSTGARCCKTAE